MKIRNIFADNLRVPDLDDLVINAGDVVDVADNIAWSLCRGLVVDPGGLHPPYHWNRFEPADSVALRTFEQLEETERRRQVGLATATWSRTRGVFEIRCYLCRRWLVRVRPDGFVTALAAAVVTERANGPDHFGSGDKVSCEKCQTRFTATIPAL